MIVPYERIGISPEYRKGISLSADKNSSFKCNQRKSPKDLVMSDSKICIFKEGHRHNIVVYPEEMIESSSDSDPSYVHFKSHPKACDILESQNECKLVGLEESSLEKFKLRQLADANHSSEEPNFYSVDTSKLINYPSIIFSSKTTNEKIKPDLRSPAYENFSSPGSVTNRKMKDLMMDESDIVNKSFQNCMPIPAESEVEYAWKNGSDAIERSHALYILRKNGVEEYYPEHSEFTDASQFVEQETMDMMRSIYKNKMVKSDRLPIEKKIDFYSLISRAKFQGKASPKERFRLTKVGQEKPAKQDKVVRAPVTAVSKPSVAKKDLIEQVADQKAIFNQNIVMAQAERSMRYTRKQELSKPKRSFAVFSSFKKLKGSAAQVRKDTPLTLENKIHARGKWGISIERERIGKECYGGIEGTVDTIMTFLTNSNEVFRVEGEQIGVPERRNLRCLESLEIKNGFKDVEHYESVENLAEEIANNKKPSYAAALTERYKYSKKNRAKTVENSFEIEKENKGYLEQSNQFLKSQNSVSTALLPLSEKQVSNFDSSMRFENCSIKKFSKSKHLKGKLKSKPPRTGSPDFRSKGLKKKLRTVQSNNNIVFKVRNFNNSKNSNKKIQRSATNRGQLGQILRKSDKFEQKLNKEGILLKCELRKSRRKLRKSEENVKKMIDRLKESKKTSSKLESEKIFKERKIKGNEIDSIRNRIKDCKGKWLANRKGSGKRFQQSLKRFGKTYKKEKSNSRSPKESRKGSRNKTDENSKFFSKNEVPRLEKSQKTFKPSLNSSKRSSVKKIARSSKNSKKSRNTLQQNKSKTMQNQSSSYSSQVDLAKGFMSPRDLFSTSFVTNLKKKRKMTPTSKSNRSNLRYAPSANNTVVYEKGTFSPAYHYSVNKVKELINQSGMLMKGEKSKEKLRNKILNFRGKDSKKKRVKSSERKLGKGLMKKINDMRTSKGGQTEQ